ncbi:hypothetical protein [Haloarchaeobius sp. TZWSO28]|uniref:hypothetical protein n=1 Tax=Haloarchaeobius sp. TZWSO28 TaxID=3446119 RepID=UPI003EC13570
MVDGGDEARSLVHETVGFVAGLATVILGLGAGLVAGFQVLLWFVRLSNRPWLQGTVDTPLVVFGLVTVLAVALAVFLGVIYLCSHLFEAVEKRVT